jgi:hypothetical protein
LLSIAVISVAVVADMYKVDSSAFIYTLALLKASGMTFVKIEKNVGRKEEEGKRKEEATQVHAVDVRVQELWSFFGDY